MGRYFLLFIFNPPIAMGHGELSEDAVNTRLSSTPLVVLTSKLYI